MNSKERLKLTLNHKEPDSIPYDLAGTTVTGINKKAFIRAMKYRGISQEYETKEVDPIQQIVTPVESTLKKLRSDTRRIGARRIPDFEKIVSRINGESFLTDVWGCNWKMNDSSDFYFNQISFPLESYPSIEEGLKDYKIPSINDHKEIILRDLEEQMKAVNGYGVIADRNCAGLTETSLRIRGYQNWFIDTITL